jgi:hypothetical protein
MESFLPRATQGAFMHDSGDSVSLHLQPLSCARRMYGFLIESVAIPLSKACDRASASLGRSAMGQGSHAQPRLPEQNCRGFGAGCPPMAPLCIFCGQYLQGDSYSAKMRAGAVERREFSGCCDPLLKGHFLQWKDGGNGTSAIRLNGQDRHPAGMAGVLRHETSCGLRNAQGRSCLTVCFAYLFILMIVFQSRASEAGNTASYRENAQAGFFLQPGGTKGEFMAFSTRRGASWAPLPDVWPPGPAGACAKRRSLLQAPCARPCLSG